MASKFQQESLKIVIAQICQNIGFQGIYSAPLEVLVDLLHRYLRDIAVSTHQYAEHYGRTEPTVDDVGLVFQDMGISISDLEEYITYVEPVNFPIKVPEIPVPKPSNLNFLKPGAREILSRPIYVHEHLPPMYPEKEEEDLNLSNSLDGENSLDDNEEHGPHSPSHLKRNSDGEASPSKKMRSNPEDEGEPVREIDSVMMTTSGYISSAREGKMPESKRPDIPLAIPHRSSSPVSRSPSSLIKKKVTMEKIIRHKNHQGGITPGPLAKPKGKHHSKMRPKIPLAPPGTGSLKRVRSPPGAGHTPKLKIPDMSKKKLEKKIEKKIEKNIEKNMDKKIEKKMEKKLEKKMEKNIEKKLDKKFEKKIEKQMEKKIDKNIEKKEEAGSENVEKEKKDGEKKRKRGEKREGKERRRKDGVSGRKRSKEDRRDSSKARERTRIRMRGLTKEEELKRYKERENELIAALAASSAVTVTSIPPPSLRVREKSPDESPQKDPLVSPPRDNKNKLSIFKKFPLKGLKEGGERDSFKGLKEGGERDSSPDLMIDDVVVKEERPSPPPSPRGDFNPFHGASPPGTPVTPKTPDIHPNVMYPASGSKRGRTPHKIKVENIPKVERTPRGRPRGGRTAPFSPIWKTPPERMVRPRTPEVDMISPRSDDMGNGSLLLPPFPQGPSLIPPFSRFPFLPPFGAPIRPPLPPDINPFSHMFLGHPGGLPEPPALDLGERPPTPTPHDRGEPRDPSPIPIPQSSAPVPIPLKASSPSKPPNQESPTVPKIKTSKADREKKKEHKKEKKEKEKLQREKEKMRKKKEKREREKAREEKRKDKKMEKEKMKKEKEKKKKDKERKEVPKLTLKFQSSENEASGTMPPPADSEAKPTPKLVIKPVVKFAEEATPSATPPPENKKKRKRSPSPSPPSPARPSKIPAHESPGSPPEIAKFSALVTRPPKGKKKVSSHYLTVEPLKIRDGGVKISKEKESGSGTVVIKSEPKEITVPPLKIRNSSSSTPVSSKSSEIKKSVSKKSEKKDKEKKKKTPPLIITSLPNVEASIKISSPVVSPPAPLPPPIPIPSEIPPTKASKKSSGPSPSTGPTYGSQQKTKGTSSGLLTETMGPIGHFVDDQGNEVWICPTCGKQDDGSPMIGCDTCDDWYHWLCVGIHVPPSERENWYCPRCLSQHKHQRGNIAVSEKKKRGRKKKIMV